MKKRLIIVGLVACAFIWLPFNQLCAQEAPPNNPTAPAMRVAPPPAPPASVPPAPAPAPSVSVAPAPAAPATAKPAESSPESAVAPEAAAPAEEATITLKQIFVKGGWIMYVIAGLSFLAIALTIFYLLTIRRGLLFPDAFMVDARDAAENNDIEALKDICADCSAPAARIIAASLDQVVAGQALDYSRIRDAMEDEGGRQASSLWQRLQYLMDIAVISPMVGLLGTVWGMMISFGGIENSAEFAKKAETLASGISQAMYTTFGGLIVGIFAMALYDVLRGRLNKIIGEMESECGSVLKRLASSKKA
ncbi:MAG: MotA/TolQ/ExbB proton channel family protein [Victivallales bacterium]|nr:MotA/TolQ/ExbB proton channel family protein [Victivallales bacterium]